MSGAINLGHKWTICGVVGCVCQHKCNHKLADLNLSRLVVFALLVRLLLTDKCSGIIVTHYFQHCYYIILKLHPEPVIDKNKNV